MTICYTCTIKVSIFTQVKKTRHVEDTVFVLGVKQNRFSSLDLKFRREEPSTAWNFSGLAKSRQIFRKFFFFFTLGIPKVALKNCRCGNLN